MKEIGDKPGWLCKVFGHRHAKLTEFSRDEKEAQLKSECWRCGTLFGRVRLYDLKNGYLK